MLSDNGWNCFKRFSVKVSMMLSFLSRQRWSSIAGRRGSPEVSAGSKVDQQGGCEDIWWFSAPAIHPEGAVPQGHCTPITA